MENKDVHCKMTLETEKQKDTDEERKKVIKNVRI